MTKIWVAAMAVAAEPGTAELVRIIDRVRNLLIGILIALAIASLTYAGIRYVLASGDPSSVEKAKLAVKSAMVGLGVALLAPLLVGLVKQILVP